MQDQSLLDEIKNSIMGMQTQMQSTYADLSKTELVGKSHDESIKIIMSATYDFKDIKFSEQAFKGGEKEFTWRMREAWKDLSEKIQKATQSKTMELLQGMDIPNDIKNLATKGDNQEGSTNGDGAISGA